MKESTVHSLVTFRVLLEAARGLCASADVHVVTAGLITLQDALEIVFLAALIELGVDEEKNLESNTFDQLIGDLRAKGVHVPKSGTLKALNKHRVIAKHYAQLAQPATVAGYFDAGVLAANAVVMAISGKSINDIFLTELLDPSESKRHLELAASLINAKSYLEALVEIRKAVFVEIESDYSIFRFRDKPKSEVDGLMGLFLGGRKAPHYTKSKEWIGENVKSPLDYIQIDYEKIRSDAVEWGCNTADLDNLRRLTPGVFRGEKDGPWHVGYDAHFPANEANETNATYCLDRAIALVRKMQAHKSSQRYPGKERLSELPTLYIGESVYLRADVRSPIVHTVTDEFEYQICSRVTGFDGETVFLNIHGSSIEKNDKGYPKTWASGYLAKSDRDES